MLVSSLKANAPHSIKRFYWQVQREGLRPPVFRVIRRLNVVGRLLLRSPVVVAQVNHGRLCVDLRDPYIGRRIYICGCYEPSETAIMKALLSPGMTMIDVGAHVGYFTTLAADLVGPRGKVIAIEPEAHNYSLLKQSIALNNLSNVAAINAAAGAREYEAVLNKSASNYGDHRLIENPGSVDRQKVVVKSLAAIASEYDMQSVDLIKIDVQGFEIEVLRGLASATGTLAPRAVLLEYWPFGLAMAGASPEDVFRILEEYNLLPASYEGGTIVPCSYQDVSQRLPPFDAAHPDSCYFNLLFLERQHPLWKK